MAGEKLNCTRVTQGYDKRHGKLGPQRERSKIEFPYSDSGAPSVELAAHVLPEKAVRRKLNRPNSPLPWTSPPLGGTFRGRLGAAKYVRF